QSTERKTSTARDLATGSAHAASDQNTAASAGGSGGNKSGFSSIPWNVHLKIIWVSSGLALVGVPGAFGAHVDVPVIITTWIGLSAYIAKAVGTHLDKDTLSKIVVGVFTYASFFMLGYKSATAAAAYTGFGTLPAIVVNSGLNGVITYVYGRA